MNRTRLALRLALIAVAVLIFFSRGGQHNPAMVKGFIVALAFAVVVVVARVVMESKKAKQMERDKQSATAGRKVDLFTKPKDF